MVRCCELGTEGPAAVIGLREKACLKFAIDGLIRSLDRARVCESCSSCDLAVTELRWYAYKLGVEGIAVVVVGRREKLAIEGLNRSLERDDGRDCSSTCS